MRLPTINTDDSIEIWNKVYAEGEFDASKIEIDYIGYDEGSDILTDLELMELTESLKKIKRKYDDKNKKNYGGIIDSEIVQPVHSELSRCATPFQLSQIGFWRWLSNLASNHFFWKFIMWRFNSEQQINWGITTPARIIEVYFYRAWIRGHKMYDSQLPDPYKYAKLGSSDVWRSHILRQDFGKDEEFVKALLDTIYDGEGNTIIKTDKLRKELIPALRAWTSSATFSHLTYSESVVLIEELLKEGV